MEPAYPLALTQQDHALIGELAEIIGQIDSIMIETVARLRNDPDARKKMGSGVASNLAVWADAIRKHVSAPEILKVVCIAEIHVKDLPELRNDFIHAHFTGDYVEPGYVEPGCQTTSAIRIRSGKSRPVSDLPEVRELALSFRVW
jgi:hypothetical protein